MAMPLCEAIDTFIGITGFSEAIAQQKLECIGGSLRKLFENLWCWHGSGSAESGTSSQVKSERKSPLVPEETEDMEEQPLVRHRSRQIGPVIAEPTDSGQPSHSVLDSPWLDVDQSPQLNGHAYERRFLFGYPTRQMPCAPSPTLMAQRLLREQQDDEYLASLQADREKELKAQQEAELHSLEEANAKEAALQKKRHEEAETHRKQIEEDVKTCSFVSTNT
ncbi:hypothetical protein ZIOFF_055144 [Zingiber officinale]|uniref:Uncharacterized protein n=1 Tax=Zingiber officinale TaxID=94328 RepID=A0A8J5FFC6_ZINOF|nr:hypothetical protein ZIOFF_055144 [Zingiber officinale]